VPFPFEHLTDKHLCIDLIYNPEETRFLKEAAMNGATTLNGLSMLKEQANKAWEIWNK
jgi:shikimate dehydrogenase